MINLHDFDLIVINTSGGKDSLVAIVEMQRLAQEQGYDWETNVVLSHQDLGNMEWQGTGELVQQHAELFGLPLYVSRYRNKHGQELSLLDKVRERGMWPSNKIRFCTSEYKRGPGERVLRAVAKERGASKVLNVFGFRAEESPARAKRAVLSENKRLKSKTRIVHDFLPVHDWDEVKVWETIKASGLPYHHAYDLGMPRLSCAFCIFAPKAALVLSGMHNRELLQEYVEVEKEIGHTFQHKLSLAEVAAEVDKQLAEGTSCDTCTGGCSSCPLAGIKKTVQSWTM